MPSVRCPVCGCCDATMPSPTKQAPVTKGPHHGKADGGCDNPWVFRENEDSCSVLFVGVELLADGTVSEPFAAEGYDRQTGHIVDRDGVMICEHAPGATADAPRCLADGPAETDATSP